MHLPSLVFVAFTCALCWVNADDSAHDRIDDAGLERDSLYEESTGNDVEDRQFDAFSQTVLQVHNEYRKRHGVPLLVLDQTVTSVAQNWANTMAARNTFAHSGTPGYGENLYYSTGTVAARDPVKAFYDEIKYYNYDAPGFSYATGHFTQVVWKSSKYIGVGKAKGSNGATYIVVNYYPPGNYHGQFPANVPRPLY